MLTYKFSHKSHESDINSHGQNVNKMLFHYTQITNIKK